MSVYASADVWGYFSKCHRVCASCKVTHTGNALLTVLKHLQTFAPDSRDITHFFRVPYEIGNRFKNYNYSG